jgi:hypothetical protein
MYLNALALHGRTFLAIDEKVMSQLVASSLA